MYGTIINVLTILAGALADRYGLHLLPDRQMLLKKLLGVFTVFVGLSWVWNSMNGRFAYVFQELVLVLLALVLGPLVGRGLGLQSRLNKMGQYANNQFNQSARNSQRGGANGFLACTIVFCLTPVAILGAFHEGCYNSIKTLLVKSFMDGLAAMAFRRSFGWKAILSVLPVLAFQGSLTLLFRLAEPALRTHHLLDMLGMTAGFLVCFVALVILDLKRIPLADYLPALLISPLLAWLWF